MDITYTIIIPHKDIPDLLQRCLDAIPQRVDVQVIVVDDNSDPGKVDFAHFPGLDRADVECYFTKEGKGAGYARNVGLKHARGKWLLFADADDFFHDGMLGMLDKWKDSECDIIYFHNDTVDSDTLHQVKSRLFWISVPQLHKKELVNLSWGVPWSKMISSRMVMDNNITFEEVMWCNDERFSFYCFYYAGDNIDKSDDNLYCTTIRKDSLVHNVTAESLMCRMAVVIRVHKIAHKLNVGYYSMGFSYMHQVKAFGRKAYIRAIIYYIMHERLSDVIRMFIKVAKFNIKRFCSQKQKAK